MGYVLGVLFFLGVIFYYIAVMFVQGAGAITYMVKSRTTKNFTFDRINLEEEYPVIRYVQTEEGLNATLREVARELGHYAFFRYENLLALDAYNKEYIASDYLMSKKGLVSRYMAEEGCYRVPEKSPQIVLDAMDAYMRLIQQNIKDKTGTTIWRKEIHWENKKRNFVWCDSPADPEYWKSGKYLTSGYKCTYRTKGMYGLGAQE